MVKVVIDHRYSTTNVGPPVRNGGPAGIEVEFRQTRIKHPREMQGQEAATGTRHCGPQADARG